MSYPESVRYLYALGNELKVGAKWGLERMQALLQELGNPQAGQHFVHVAGTNGKGSTSAAIASVLQASGYRTGLYTSPHLIAPTERIQINGVPVSEQDFAEAFATVHAAAERSLANDRIDGHPSYFETVTAMAFLLFAEQRTQISVIEVGLGGRLDATNVIDPELTVITPVAFDHEAFLGNTLRSIASEKAGIVKQGVPVVLAEQAAEARLVIEERAHSLGAPVKYSHDLHLSDVHVTAEGSEWTCDRTHFATPLAGRHQIENGRTALLACRTLQIPDETIAKGLKQTRWPGRLETVSRHPDFILDGAHNPAGAEALADYIQEFFAHRIIWMVYGAMRDKAIDEVTEILFPLAQHLILTTPDFERALRPQAILEVRFHANATTKASLPQAIAYARTAPSDAVVFFTGSLYLVGEARKLLVP